LKNSALGAILNSLSICRAKGENEMDWKVVIELTVYGCANEEEVSGVVSCELLHNAKYIGGITVIDMNLIEDKGDE
jgi:hypothetical protein